jgi:hypothetical protein
MTPELKKIIAEYIIGARRELTLVGQPTTIAVVAEAAKSSRKLYETLETGDVEKVSTALESKRLAVSRYERVFGIDWDL